MKEFWVFTFLNVFKSLSVISLFHSQSAFVFELTVKGSENLYPEAWNIFASLYHLCQTVVVYEYCEAWVLVLSVRCL